MLFYYIIYKISNTTKISNGIFSIRYDLEGRRQKNIDGNEARNTELHEFGVDLTLRA